MQNLEVLNPLAFIYLVKIYNNNLHKYVSQSIIKVFPNFMHFHHNHVIHLSSLVNIYRPPKHWRTWYHLKLTRNRFELCISSTVCGKRAMRKAEMKAEGTRNNYSRCSTQISKKWSHFRWREVEETKHTSKKIHIYYKRNISTINEI